MREGSERHFSPCWKCQYFHAPPKFRLVHPRHHASQAEIDILSTRPADERLGNGWLVRSPQHRHDPTVHFSQMSILSCCKWYHTGSQSSHTWFISSSSWPCELLTLEIDEFIRTRMWLCSNHRCRIDQLFIMSVIFTCDGNTSVVTLPEWLTGSPAT